MAKLEMLMTTNPFVNPNPNPCHQFDMCHNLPNDTCHAIVYHEHTWLDEMWM